MAPALTEGRAHIVARMEVDSDAGLGAVLRAVRRHGPLTRADIGEQIGLKRSAVAQRVDALAARGLVHAHSERTSSGGRPPTTIAFNPAAGVVLAVAVGARQTRLEVADLAGAACSEATVDLPIDAGPDRLLRAVARSGAKLLAGEAAGRPLFAVGVGVPGPVEHATGRPVSPPIMPGWDDCDIAGRLRTAFDVDVLVDNDVNTMALAEHALHPDETDDLLFAHVGTGIGCAIVSGGRLFRGAEGAAGEIGHIPLSGHDDPCHCGNAGCLEAVIGADAIARHAALQGLTIADAAELTALVARHDPTAVAFARASGRLLGEVVAGLVNALNPRVVMLGGTLAEAEPFAAGVRELVYQRGTPLATRALAIAVSSLGARAGTRGAAILAIEHALSPRVLDTDATRLPAGEAQAAGCRFAP